MYTLDTNSLLNVVPARLATTPVWFNAEKYYNCENFYLSFESKHQKQKKHKFHL